MLFMLYLTFNHTSSAQVIHVKVVILDQISCHSCQIQRAWPDLMHHLWQIQHSWTHLLPSSHDSHPSFNSLPILSCFLFFSPNCIWSTNYLVLVYVVNRDFCLRPTVKLSTKDIILIPLFKNNKRPNDQMTQMTNWDKPHFFNWRSI
jgi:hypothetical protein